MKLVHNEKKNLLNKHIINKVAIKYIIYLQIKSNCDSIEELIDRLIQWGMLEEDHHQNPQHSWFLGNRTFDYVWYNYAVGKVDLFWRNMSRNNPYLPTRWKLTCYNYLKKARMMLLSKRIYSRARNRSVIHIRIRCVI